MLKVAAIGLLPIMAAQALPVKDSSMFVHDFLIKLTMASLAIFNPKLSHSLRVTIETSKPCLGPIILMGTKREANFIVDEMDGVVARDPSPLTFMLSVAASASDRN